MEIEHSGFGETVQWMQDLNDKERMGSQQYTHGDLNVFDTVHRSREVNKSEVVSTVNRRCLNGRSTRAEHTVTSVIVDLEGAGRPGEVTVVMVTPTDRVADIMDELRQDAEPISRPGVMPSEGWELVIEGSVLKRAATMWQLKMKDLAVLTIKYTQPNDQAISYTQAQTSESFWDQFIPKVTQNNTVPVRLTTVKHQMITQEQSQRWMDEPLILQCNECGAEGEADTGEICRGGLCHSCCKRLLCECWDEEKQ